MRISCNLFFFTDRKHKHNARGKSKYKINKSCLKYIRRFPRESKQQSLQNEFSWALNRHINLLTIFLLTLFLSLSVFLRKIYEPKTNAQEIEKKTLSYLCTNIRNIQCVSIDMVTHDDAHKPFTSGHEFGVQ